jgi:hypothetical protein
MKDNRRREENEDRGKSVNKKEKNEVKRIIRK